VALVARLLEALELLVLVMAQAGQTRHLAWSPLLQLAVVAAVRAIQEMV
jgi:hypothetical protein